MDRTNKRLLLLLFTIILFIPGIIKGQEKDFQVWISGKVNMEVLPGFKVHIEEELRLHENASQIARQINDVGLSYRINRLLKAGVFYRLEADWKNADTYEWRNAIYGDVSARTKIDRLTIGYRLRIQSQKAEFNKPDDYMFDGIRHRHKASFEYNIRGIPLTPFIEDEVFVNYSRAEGSRLNENRAWLGMDYSIQKRHVLTLKFGINHEWNEPSPFTGYIVAVGYALDLNLQDQSKE